MDGKTDIALENLPIINQDANDNATVDGQKMQYHSSIHEDDFNENAEEYRLTSDELAHYRYLALFVAWMSVVLLLVIGTLSFIVSQIINSSVAFGFGFDCILDVGTSIVVIWRFTGSVGNLYSEERERMALFFLGILFLGACASILVRAIPDLIGHSNPKDNLWVILIASVSCVICASLAAAKFYIANQLQSMSIRSDGFSSLAGAITCLSWVVTAASIKYNPTLWFLDDIVGICVAVLLLLYGLKLLFQVVRHPQVISAIKSMCNSDR